MRDVESTAEPIQNLDVAEMVSKFLYDMHLHDMTNTIIADH